MKTEREIRSYRNNIKASMDKNSCMEPDCANCRENTSAIHLLSWVLGETVPSIDQHAEAAAMAK